MIFFQDQNLIPKGDEKQFIQIEIRHRDVFLVKVDKTLPFGDFTGPFCKQNNIKPSTARFLYDGERIQENNTLETLGIKDGDMIEVFTILTGGGKPHKKNISGDSSKILNLLDSVSVSENSDSTCSGDEHD